MDVFDYSSTTAEIDARIAAAIRERDRKLAERLRAAARDWIPKPGTEILVLWLADIIEADD